MASAGNATDYVTVRAVPAARRSAHRFEGRRFHVQRHDVRTELGEGHQACAPRPAVAWLGARTETARADAAGKRRYDD